MNPHTINHLMMEDLAKIYNDAFHHTFDNLVTEPRQRVAEFWLQLLAAMKPYMMVSATGIASVRDLVFSDTVLTDFVFTLTFNFFTRAALTDEEKVRFASIVGGSVSMQFKNHQALSEFDALPTQLSTRLSTERDATDILSANPWLLTLVVASVFMNHTALLRVEKERKGAGNGQRGS